MRRPMLLVMVFAALLVACAPPPPDVAADCSARGPGVDLHGCDLRGVVFQGDPDDLDPYGTARPMDLSGADLDGANLTGASFFGPLDLSGASFRGADLTRATFGDGGIWPVQTEGADFTGADLTSTQLYQVELDGDFTDARLELHAFRSSVTGTFLRTDLRGSAFVTSALTGDLRTANLDGTSWSRGGTFHGDLRGVSLRSASFGGGMGTSVSGVDLTGANLTNAEMIFTDFVDVDFTRTNFTGANLIGFFPGDLDPNSATNTFTRVIWSNTICPDGTVRSTPCV